MKLLKIIVYKYAAHIGYIHGPNTSLNSVEYADLYLVRGEEYTPDISPFNVERRAYNFEPTLTVTKEWNYHNETPHTLQAYVDSLYYQN